MMTQKQKTTMIYSLPALILVFAVLGNLFSKEFNWSPSDFLIGGILLFGTAIIIDLIRRIVKNQTYKIFLCIVVLFILIFTWVELAVGLFGTPFAGS
ncbi:hypothetical protein [Chryseobacterium indoltheticum]|uniref:Uncharacterized protein n=1 Tax=Chryseobacterium indoltheticum TaxID=254 RepID=A0A381JQI6_9FLAO|nr:hypothetical protein [Chryseobacterium indoltheticum]SIQ43868.1 hypothetical protein SAMN05421682_10532 [Chryseobacterium indoltheticum]SUY53713.1 Uncharacterised protein [Chryseobacterium indoltheticum]